MPLVTVADHMIIPIIMIRIINIITHTHRGLVIACYRKQRDNVHVTRDNTRIILTIIL